MTMQLRLLAAGTGKEVRKQETSEETASEKLSSRILPALFLIITTAR